MEIIHMLHTYIQYIPVWGPSHNVHTLGVDGKSCQKRAICACTNILVLVSSVTTSLCMYAYIFIRMNV